MPPSRQSDLDLSSLSVVQLQKLADRGSRRARAELERRMAAADLRQPPVAATPAIAHPPAAVPPRPFARTPPAGAVIPTLTVRADAAPPGDEQFKQLQLIARQNEARSRETGPPRLVGMVLIAWGVLLLLGGLVVLPRSAGLYYLFCGAGAAAVGGLLMRCSRWATALHAALLLLALGWAWAGSARHSLALTVLQAAPLLIAALWMAVGAVREPLR